MLNHLSLALMTVVALAKESTAQAEFYRLTTESTFAFLYFGNPAKPVGRTYSSGGTPLYAEPDGDPTKTKHEIKVDPWRYQSPDTQYGDYRSDSRLLTFREFR